MEVIMTTLLSKAFEKVSSLPDTIQDAIAMELLEEIEWEKEWDNTISTSSKELDILAEKALREFKQGKTTEMGFDDL
jgi:ubiquinone biosynthesis protein Coq4